MTSISPDWSHNLYDDNTVTTIYWSSSGDFIVVGTKDGDVYQTQNGGKTWRNITPFGRGYIGNEMVVSILVDPHHHHRLYVIYGSNGSAPFVPYHKPQVFYSVDDGQSFKAMDGNLPKTPDSSAIMFKNSVVIGTARGVYASVWGQDSWTPVGHGLPDTPVTSIVVTPKRLYVGTNGNGVWLMPIHH